MTHIEDVVDTITDDLLPLFDSTVELVLDGHAPAKCDSCRQPADLTLEYIAQIETGRPNPMGWQALNYGPDGIIDEYERDVHYCIDCAYGGITEVIVYEGDGMIDPMIEIYAGGQE